MPTVRDENLSFSNGVMRVTPRRAMDRFFAMWYASSGMKMYINTAMSLRKGLKSSGPDTPASDITPPKMRTCRKPFQ
jgi:hypothetical protein